MASRDFFIYYALLWIISIFLLIKLLHIHTLKHFKEVFNSDGDFPEEEYISLGKIVFITSHHHGEFKLHEATIAGKRICTGCYGSALGLVIGLFLFPLIATAVYQQSISNISEHLIHLRMTFLFCSAISVLFSFIKYLKEITRWSRLFLNSLFLIGIWLSIWAYLDINFSIIILVLHIGTQMCIRMYLTELSHK